MPTPLDNIIGVLTELITELYEFLMRTEGLQERPGWSQQLEQYTRKTLQIRLLAGQGDHIGLHDACMQQQEYLRALVKRGVTPTAHEWDRLERWPLLLLPCLVTPVIEEAVDELIAYFKNNTCALAFSEHDAQSLRTNLLTPPRTAPATNGNNIVTLPMLQRALPVQLQHSNIDHDASAETTVRYVLQHELLDTISEYLSVADPPETTAAEHAQALRLCADRIQLLGISAAGSELIGLMDCCLLCHDALIKRLDADSQLSAIGREQIQIWADLVARYLDTPGSVEAVDALLDFYQHGQFIPAMLKCEYDSLREFLLITANTRVAPRVEIKLVPERSPGAQVVTMPFLVRATQADVPPEVAAAPVAGPTVGHGSDSAHAAAALSEPVQELLKSVCAEIAQARLKLSDSLTIATKASTFSAARDTVLTEYAQSLDRFAATMQAMCLAGIHAVIAHASNNVRAWQAQHRVLTDAECDVLTRCPEFVISYLSTPGSIDVCDKIQSWLASPLWINELSVYELARIAQDLRAPDVILEAEHLVQRTQQAQPKDVALTLPQDVNSKLLETLLQELPQHAAEFSGCIHRIAQGQGTLADVETAQRNAHTLKGAANTASVVGIATLTHHVEDILSAYAAQQRVPSGTAANILLAAADVLEMMSEALLGRGSAPAHAQASLQDIINLANAIDADGLPSTDVQAPLPQAIEPVITRHDKPSLVTGQSVVMLRVPANVIDDLLRLAGESMVMTGQLQERLRLTRRQSKIGAEQNALLQQLLDELERRTEDFHRTHALDAVELEKHDELRSVTRRIIEAATDARDLSRQLDDHLAVFGDLIPALARVSKDNQEAVMRTRMVPASSIVARLQRSVRQTCRVTCKQVNLTVSGADTLLDSDVLDDLVDPLMHLLHNAIDHGIEPSEARHAAGKPDSGAIDLRFTRDGDHIVVQCCDDGAGLDYEHIQQVAVQKGLLDTSKPCTQDDLNRVILLAGFSTRSETTQTSGRGIGLDIVYSRVLGMKGSLSIVSRPQHGCTIELRIPLTLMSIHTLLVQSRTQVLAISSRCVEQILYAGSGQVRIDDERLQFCVAEECYDAYEVEQLLHLPIDRRWLERGDRPALLVRDSTGQLRAVFVEQVLANQDLVVKQLGPYLPNILGIEGATILGNGGIAAVIDLPGLLQTAQPDRLAPLLVTPDPDDVATTTPVALVVDDSASARRVLAEFVNDLGFEVITAIDGVTALAAINKQTPDLVLTDMDMPRLNGLELTEHLRAMPRTQHLPIIMISSSCTQKHHKLALSAGVNVYMTKPFSEGELAEQIRSLTNTITES